MHLDHAASKYTHAILMGLPGSGKTCSLNFIGSEERVLSLANMPTGALPSSFSGNLVLLDDAQPSQTEYLSRLGAELPNARILVTSQVSGVIPEGFSFLSLQPLNHREISSMAQAWFPAARPAAHSGFVVVSRQADGVVSAIKAHQRTRALAGNPLNLFLLLQVYAAGIPLPTNRAPLFEAYFKSLLQTKIASSNSSRKVPGVVDDPEFAAQALEGIALATKRGELAKSEHLARAYGLLRTTPSGHVEFVHPLIQDFLAARALRRSPEPSALLEHAADDDWREAILFYSGLGDPRALVEALLGSGRLELAAHALAEAPQIPDDLLKTVVDPLVQQSWEHEDSVAISALRALGSNAATDLMAGKLKDRDPSARSRAAYILGRLNTERSVEYLLPQLRDTDPDVRDRVIAALGQSTSDRVVEPLLVALRGDSRVGSVDRRMRVAAARALGDVGSEKAVPALIVDLQVGEPEVRSEAVKALLMIRSSLAIKPLQAIADSNQSADVREAATHVLEGL